MWKYNSSFKSFSTIEYLNKMSEKRWELIYSNNIDLGRCIFKRKIIKKKIEICTCKSVETTDIARWSGIYHHVTCKKPLYENI